MSTIVVTGGSGFIAAHCIVGALAEGHAVRATLRNLSREAEVRAMVRAGGASDEGLRFFRAELDADAGWAEAIGGADFVLHVASPTLATPSDKVDDFVRPAREGVLRVLRASREHGVKRVVLTSAFGAIGYGHPPRATPFTEDDWTDLDGDVAPYQRSKTLAGRAAWDFVQREPSLELAVVNPAGVLGPLLGPDVGPSLQLPLRLLKGELRACPRFTMPFVDVRDVAALHLLAMTRAEAKGERFIASSGPALSVLDVANILRARLGALAARVPQRELPDWLVRATALFRADVRVVLPQLGKALAASGEKAQRVLGWRPRGNEESLVDTAQGFVRFGLLSA